MMNYVFLAALVGSVYGHGVIKAVTGDNGVVTMGFGVTNDIPRDGTTEQPFQLDTPVLKDLATDPCGATLQGGSIDITKSLQTAIQQGGGSLPTLSANGSITMTIHQVNADGGGPYTAMVNTDATGKTWVAATVTQQVPGAQGLLRGGPVDSQFTAQVPSGTVCTGGDDGNTCLIRINNGGANQTNSFANGAGPFGGCVAVTNNAATSTGGSAATTAAAASATSKAKTGKNSNKKQQARRSKEEGRELLRRFFPSLARSSEDLDSLISKRQELDATIELKRRELVERQLLTVDLIDELKTATGTAIDIPIDALAGQIDENANGGNSSTAKNAVLSTQQAVDLKQAVKTAIDGVLSVMATSPDIEGTAAGFATANHLSAEVVAQANADAAASIADGSLTSINLGNAGVGNPNTAVVDSLLGGISDANTATIGASLAAGGVTTTAAAAAATATTKAKAAGAAQAAGAQATGRASLKHNKFGKRHALNKRMLLSRMPVSDSE